MCVSGRNHAFNNIIKRLMRRHVNLKFYVTTTYNIYIQIYVKRQYLLLKSLNKNPHAHPVLLYVIYFFG